MAYSDEEELKNRVATSCHILSHEGAGRTLQGHVSARADGESIFIKARGPEEEGLEFVTANDVIRVDLNAQPIDAPKGLAPPAESAIHLAMYRARPDVNCAIHVHPSVVVALTAANRPLVPIYNGYDPAGLALFESGIPIFPRSILISTPALGDELAAVMGNASVCILKGHGIVAVGHDVEEATAAAFALCELAQLNWMAYAVGTPEPLADSERAAPPSGNVAVEAGRGGLRRADGTTSLWNWLAKRADR